MHRTPKHLIQQIKRWVLCMYLHNKISVFWHWQELKMLTMNQRPCNNVINLTANAVPLRRYQIMSLLRMHALVHHWVCVDRVAAIDLRTPEADLPLPHPRVSVNFAVMFAACIIADKQWRCALQTKQWCTADKHRTPAHKHSALHRCIDNVCNI